ncbi:MAG: hypothetical protein HY861_02840 [Chlamydiia bacterium]|nr:hypothetical protein [Chlamydiia bacterium]
MRSLTLHEVILEKLFALPGRGLKTFAEFQTLDRRLGCPHRAFRTVHVGGTNGKGSVATKIAEGLQEEGFRVGLYTSPHITSVRERICINGVMISEKALLLRLEEVFKNKVSALSFFDILTAAAFSYFREERVDWAVVEVGIGGRLDATNVIDPVLAIITSISYDHKELLGDTLEKIAQEKGGIAKRGVPLIVGPSAAPFFSSAQTVLPEIGFYDRENSAIAARALRELGVSERAIEKAIQVRPRGRFEMMGRTVIDVAHNPDGFQRLGQALEEHFPGEKFHFIVAFSQGKDWKACLDVVRPLAHRISFVNSHSRFVPLGGGTLQEALDASDEGVRNVLCGSFYLVAEALNPQQGGGFGAIEPSLVPHLPQRRGEGAGVLQKR